MPPLLCRYVAAMSPLCCRYCAAMWRRYSAPLCGGCELSGFAPELSGLAPELSGFTPEFDSAGGEMTDVIANMAKLSAEDREGIAAYDAFRSAASAVSEGDYPEVMQLDEGGIFARNVWACQMLKR